MGICGSCCINEKLVCKDGTVFEGVNNTLLEKLNVRIGEIGEKYKEPPERPSKATQYDSKKRGQKKSKNRFKSKKIKKKRRKFGRR